MSRFGSPFSPNGAMYVIRDREDMIQFLADTFKNYLRWKGEEITPAIETEILALARMHQDEMDRQYDAKGIPEKLKMLLEIKRKSEVIKYCKSLVLSADDLFLLGHNCSQIGFTHRSKFSEFVPQHLNITDSDIDDMKKGNPRQFLKKVHGVFQERKRIHVHLFEKDEEWHCFYFTWRDTESSNESHWKHGSHLHYISHLWPNLVKRQVWESFDWRNVETQGSVHIRLQV